MAMHALMFASVAVGVVLCMSSAHGCAVASTAVVAVAVAVAAARALALM